MKLFAQVLPVGIALLLPCFLSTAAHAAAKAPTTGPKGIVINQTKVPAGDSNCPMGGIKITTSNDDGTNSQTNYLCAQ